MNKELTEIVFILDRSGSMCGLEADTIGGFNSMLEKQKQAEGNAILSAVLFSDQSQVLYDRVDIERIEPMTDRQYQVGGCIALLDAIGGAVHHIGNVHKYAREEDRPGKTVFVITTDGMENSSRRYSYEKVQKIQKISVFFPNSTYSFPSYVADSSESIIERFCFFLDSFRQLN